MPVLKIYLGDVVRMRKTHPCGSDQWEVVRLGADIGIKCLKCGRRVLMPRVKFERRVRTFLARGPEAAAPPAGTPTAPPAGPPAKGAASSGGDAR